MHGNIGTITVLYGIAYIHTYNVQINLQARNDDLSPKEGRKDTGKECSPLSMSILPGKCGKYELYFGIRIVAL